MRSYFIFPYCIKLADYYISNGFVMLENNLRELNNLTLRVKQRINAEHICKNVFVMACYSVISFASNNLTIITICYGLYRDFASLY